MINKDLDFTDAQMLRRKAEEKLKEEQKERGQACFGS